MSWVLVAVGGSAVLGAGASYLGSKKQSDASKAAGNLNMEMFNTLNQQQQPYMQSGYGAMGRLNTLLGINPRPQMAQPSGAADPRAPYDRILQADAGTPMTRMLQRALGQAMSEGGDAPAAPSPAYIPMPGGGMRRIAQVGPQSGGQSNSKLSQLLALRARNGDTQARALLERLG